VKVAGDAPAVRMRLILDIEKVSYSVAENMCEPHFIGTADNNTFGLQSNTEFFPRIFVCCPHADLV
jgi:hypothetical protein